MAITPQYIGGTKGYGRSAQKMRVQNAGLEWSNNAVLKAAFFANMGAANLNVNPIVFGAGVLLQESASDNLTAAGTNQGNALVLTSEVNTLGTVGVGTGVQLPPSAAGLTIIVINKGANSLQVYGKSPDTIDAIATGTGVSQMPNSMVIYSCTVAGAWYSEGLATGFGGPGLQTLSNTNGITAFAGGGQGSAVLLTTMINRITTVGTANDSVKLPVSAAGMQIIVANAAAANAANVFPNTGEQINVLGANTAFSLAANKTATFTCTNAGQWHSTLSA